MATIESGLLQDINVLAARVAEARATDARRGAAQIKVLTLELRVKWDELRAARVAVYGPDLGAFLPEGYHAGDTHQYRSRPTSIERGAAASTPKQSNERRIPMTVTAATHIQLNRAYVQSKVIEANLHHVTDVLSRGDGDLGEDLQSFTQRFGEFVLRLSDASDIAAAKAARRNQKS